MYARFRLRARSPCVVIPVVQFVSVDLAAQRIAVNSQNLRRARLVPLCALQHPLDEPLFKFPHRLIEQYSPLHHLAHESFELILHGTLQREARNSGPGASLVRARSGCGTLPGTCLALQPRPPEAAAGRAGSLASECSPGSRVQTVCRMKVAARQVCTARRAKIVRNPA